MLSYHIESGFVCRDEVSQQIAGFQQQWFGRMHRIDKFFHRVKPPPGATMKTHKGVTARANISPGPCHISLQRVTV